MSSNESMTKRLLNKIEKELGSENYSTYRATFASFAKGELDYQTYQQKITELLGIQLLPFHQRFANLFRKRVVSNKSIQQFKAIMIRIKEEKREARLYKIHMIKGESSNNLKFNDRNSNDMEADKNDLVQSCFLCGKFDCHCKGRSNDENGAIPNASQSNITGNSQILDNNSHKFMKRSESFQNINRTGNFLFLKIREMINFIIDSKGNSYYNKIVMTSRDRKGNIHPGLQELIKNEEDEFVGTSQRRRRMRQRYSDDMLEESKFDPLEDDADSMTSKQKDQQLAQENSADPPFKIIIAERRNYFDWNNATSGMLLDKIFKDLKINNKINELCRINSLKNDFKSINIDNFIDNFKQTYPQHLNFQARQAESLENLAKESNEDREFLRDAKGQFAKRKGSLSE